MRGGRLVTGLVALILTGASLISGGCTAPQRIDPVQEAYKSLIHYQGVIKDLKKRAKESKDPNKTKELESDIKGYEEVVKVKEREYKVAQLKQEESKKVEQLAAVNVEQPESARSLTEITTEYNENMKTLKNEREEESKTYFGEHKKGLDKYDANTDKIKENTRKTYERIKEAVDKEIERMRKYKESLGENKSGVNDPSLK